jgi:hypothetical protein
MYSILRLHRALTLDLTPYQAADNITVHSCYALVHAFHGSDVLVHFSCL